jgi:hypothetical protein
MRFVRAVLLLASCAFCSVLGAADATPRLTALLAKFATAHH